jgi:hypothetical protein
MRSYLGEAMKNARLAHYLSRVVVASAGILVLAGPASAAPFVIAPATAAEMVATLVAGSTGITVVAGSEVYTGAPTASGTFTGGTCILPFNTGIVLTTGSAVGAIGPNDDPAFGVINGTPGDAQLSTLSGQLTFDAATLEFRFIPTAPTISFQYVFGSEEYNEFVGSEFNDVFAFFLNGVNIALIPGTTTPITINTVNCSLNSQFYTDNGGGPGVSAELGPCGDANLDTQYDGLVGAGASMLFAIGNVNPGVENTIKLAIADAGDEDWDSGVFLAGGSFTNQPPVTTPVPDASASLSLLGIGIAILAALKRRLA